MESTFDGEGRHPGDVDCNAVIDATEGDEDVPSVRVFEPLDRRAFCSSANLADL